MGYMNQVWWRIRRSLQWRTLGGIVALELLTLFAAPFAHAQGYPDHPVKVIVPFATAGPTDVVARLITQKLSERLKQQFYIENIAGAGGNLGMGNAAKSAPDGYTILLGGTLPYVNEALLKARPGSRVRTATRE